MRLHLFVIQFSEQGPGRRSLVETVLECQPAPGLQCTDCLLRDGADRRQAVRVLKPGGWLPCEHGFDQGAAARAVLGKLGYEAVETRPDLARVQRVTSGRRPAG